MPVDSVAKPNSGMRRFLTLILGAKTPRRAPPAAERQLIEEEGPLSREEILKLRQIQIRSAALYDPRPNPAAPNGFYAGRPIIKDAAPIGGGIYLGLVGHEAVVVDERGECLKDAYEELLARLMRYGTLRDKSERAVVSEAVALARDLLRYDEELVSHILERETIECDQRVSLDLFLREGIGAARHQVLLSGWLLEQLKKNSIIKGNIHIESTLDPNSAPLERLGYTTLSGDSVVFDPRAYELAVRCKLAAGSSA